MVRRVDVLSLSDKAEQGTLGTRITLLREQIGWSVAEFALAANVVIGVLLKSLRMEIVMPLLASSINCA